MKLKTLRSIAALIAAGALSAAAVVSPAMSAGFFTNGVPPAGGTQYPTTLPLTGAETLPADTNLAGGLNPASEAISTAQLAGYIGSAYGGVNYLIGGDFGTNLWQRGTTSANITTSATYGPDRWWGISGTSTQINLIKETGATDITAGFAASARLQRTAAQTGVVSSCMGQVLTSANSTSLQGKKVEFATWIQAGANFSASPSQVTMTIATGTGSDQSAANFAAGTWTGYAAAAAQATTIGTTWTHVSAVATIPATATQVGVKICYTPVGTAGANDWFEIAGAQLDVNAGAIANNGTASTAYSIGAFPVRNATAEQVLEQAYYYQLNETNGGYIAAGLVSATNVETAVLAFPVTMRAVPTCTYTAGGLEWNIAGAAPAAVGTLTQVSGSSASILTIGDTKTATAGGTAFLLGSNTTGKIMCTAEL